MHATANIHALPAPRKPRAKRTARPAAAKGQSRQQYAAAGVAAVAVVLTALSLAHLSAGVALLTKAPAAEAWAMAIGIDLSYLALEAGQLAAVTAAARRAVSRFAMPAIIGTLAASGIMNALAFAHQSEGWMMYASAALGASIPALVYALSRTAFALASK